MMNKQSALLTYVLRLADSALILGQRLTEIVAAGPELEEELANANFALDYLGQARMLYSYAGELEGQGRTEDDFALLRGEREFQNLLLVEQPNGHFGDTIVRAVLFDSFYLLQLEAIAECSDAGLAAIAVRAAKEIRYHKRHAVGWLIRLGDGTEESHRRTQESLNRLWQYTGEMYAADEIDEHIREQFDGPDLRIIGQTWIAEVSALAREAKLTIPDNVYMASGGREGRHSEQFGFMIAEMQYMQRAYPGLSW